MYLNQPLILSFLAFVFQDIFARFFRYVAALLLWHVFAGAPRNCGALLPTNVAAVALWNVSAFLARYVPAHLGLQGVANLKP